MASFETIVLIIAVIILIICLTGVGVAIYFNKYSTVFPPISATCPDGYTTSSANTNSSKTICTNSNLPSSIPQSCGSIQVNSPQYTGKNGLCQKYKWTQLCHASWPGVTEESTNQCPL